MSYVFDDLFRIPFTDWRFGVDPILGILPVIGDAVGFLTTGYLFVEAWLLDMPRNIYVRMLFNLLVDFIFGSIPIIGTIFDVFWKANDRNVRILETHLRERAERRHQHAQTITVESPGE